MVAAKDEDDDEGQQLPLTTFELLGTPNGRGDERQKAVAKEETRGRGGRAAGGR
jgi:hypothetical protein